MLFYINIYLLFKGIIRCQLIENQLDDAAQQLDFLQEVQQSIGRTSVSIWQFIKPLSELVLG